MWVPFAVILGLFSLLVGGLVVHKIDNDQINNPPPIHQERAAPPSLPDAETQK